MKLNIFSWTEAYLKYKDTIHRKIESFNKKSDKELVVELKNGIKQEYLCVNDLSSLSVADLKDRVSCLNTKKNVDWLISNWQEVKETDVVFLFANPDKSAHWSINPKLHNRVTESKAVKPGLKALFDSIPEV